MDLTGKNVVYVGGFGGLGLAVGKELLSKHIANLVVLDDQEQTAELRELKAINPNVQVHFQQLDLTKGIDTIRRVFTNVLKEINHIDVLVNGAGICDERKIDETVQINLTGLINTTTVAIELWDKRQGGNGGLVINLASILGLEPIKELPIYAATNAGIIQFTRSIARAHDITGVSAVVVCPSFTKTTLMSKINTYLNVGANFVENMKKVPQQSVEIFAEKFMEVYEQADNGSIWIIGEGQVQQVVLPTIYELPQVLN